MHVLVMAKEPVPGRVKTRLCPPCTPEEAAELATACLADTLEAAARSGADRTVLALDGRPGEWCPPGVTVIAQTPGSFDSRLAAAWRAAGGPGVQIGMDTPQVTPALLDAALATIDSGSDATLGPAEDGGWWLIGFRQPHPDAFRSIPMSRPDTCAQQHARLLDLGLSVGTEPTLRDVDVIADALAVAADASHTRFGVCVDRLLAGSVRR